MNIDVTVDRFVERLMLSGLRFDPITSSPWIESLEERLPARFPRSFRSLVRRYRFRSFSCGGVHFFGNLGTGEDEDFVTAVFKDPYLTGALQNGFIQIGRPDTGSYDLICFSTDRKSVV